MRYSRTRSGRNGSTEIRRNLVHQINKAATETLQVLRRTGNTAEAFRPVQQKRIERNAGTVGLQGCLIVCIDEVVLEVI